LRGELRAFETRRIAQALAGANGSQMRAARALGISRQALWKKLSRARAHAGPMDEEESWPRRR
jgi:transcriptional regulator with PAS, ATPase and Fis domain